MAALTMERTVEEIVAGWRDGELEGPAGPLFNEGYTPYEITATGGQMSLSPEFSEMSGSYDPCKGMWYWCC